MKRWFNNNHFMENRKAVFTEAYQKVLQNLPADPVLPIPLLREFAGPGATAAAMPAAKNGLLWKRLERRYLRFCAVQEGLSRLDFKDFSDFKKSGGSASFDDFVFSRTDFSRYGKIPENRFILYSEGLEDFDDCETGEDDENREKIFFTKNFRMGKAEVEKTINLAFKKISGFYLLTKPTPVILAILRTLETSTETLPLLRPEEILAEMKSLYEYLDAGPFPAGSVSGFYSYLVGRLDNTIVIHSDGAETKLFIDESGNLLGTFKPGGKAWTVVLAPKVQ
jgi:hypothetical protein